MRFYAALFTSACVLALAAPASAQLAGTVSGGYTHFDVDQLNINEWSANGAVVGSLSDSGVNLQGDLGYANLSAVHDSASEWNIGGAAFWANDILRAGGTVNYTNVSASGNDGGLSGHDVNYGAFGEFYIDRLTLGAKGGGFNVSDGPRGLYLGGEAVGYILPDFAISATVDYTKFNSTDFTPQVEWLVSEGIPVSVYAGYTYASVSISGASGNGNLIFGGIRIYLNGTSGAPLIDQQRTGTVNWGTNFGPASINL